MSIKVLIRALPHFAYSIRIVCTTIYELVISTRDKPQTGPLQARRVPTVSEPAAVQREHATTPLLLQHGIRQVRLPQRAVVRAARLGDRREDCHLRAGHRAGRLRQLAAAGDYCAKSRFADAHQSAAGQHVRCRSADAGSLSGAVYVQQFLPGLSAGRDWLPGGGILGGRAAGDGSVQSVCGELRSVDGDRAADGDQDHGARCETGDGGHVAGGRGVCDAAGDFSVLSG